ncbi:MAG TPA: hypothetical protein VH249_13935 [Xanthobacteraceae bacterium]|jgi:hypothetical protein|nr:hypothetical protein [Xanthobacteraceae bacterium]
MPASATSLDRLRALVWDDVRLRERLYQPDDADSFVALVVASGRDHGLDLAAADVAAAMEANRQGAPCDPGAVRLPPAGWLPSRTCWQQQDLHVEWSYVGTQPLRDPFFGQTARRAWSKPFNLLFCHATPIGALAQARTDCLPPTGFIFHMSRCGSTLVTQMLAAIARNIVVSEPAPVDEVVQARHLMPDLSEEQQAVWLAAMVAAFGRVRSGEERHFFIKLDAWHTLALPLFRRAFPTVPWIFLYRDPVEVMVSQRRQPGVHMVPGMVGPDLFGVPAPQFVLASEDYHAQILARICDGALQHYADDTGLLVNYRELPSAVWTSILPHLGVACSDDDRARMAQAARRDAKSPKFEFAADSADKQEEASDAIRAAAATRLGERYDRLEALRLRR